MLDCAQSLPPVRVCVPDTRWAAFAAEAHRQSQAIVADAHAADGQAFVDASPSPGRGETRRNRLAGVNGT